MENMEFNSYENSLIKTLKLVKIHIKFEGLSNPVALHINNDSWGN